MDDMERARGLFERALEHHNAGNLETAEALYREAAVLAPTRVSVLQNLAATVLSQLRFAEAQSLFERVLALDPTNDNAREGQAYCLRMLAVEQARDAAGRDAPMRPEEAGLLREHALLLETQGRLQDALQSYRAACIALPDDLATATRYAGVLLKLGHTADGIEGFRRLLADPEAPAGAGEYFVQLVLELRIAPEGQPPALEDLLVRALRECWGAPEVIAPLLLRVLRDRPHFAACLRAANAGPDAFAAAPDIDPLQRDPVLHALLVSTVVPDPDVERVLTLLRHRLLVATSAPSSVAGLRLPDLAFRIALARQCHLNGFVYARSAGESTLLGTLSARLHEALASGAVVPPEWVCALAAYGELGELDPAGLLLRAHAWPAELRALLDLHIRNRQQLGSQLARIPRLTAIRDATSQAVRTEFEAGPHPPEAAAPRRTPRSFAAYVAGRLGMVGTVDESVARRRKALVAGCGTGRHPIELASLVPDMDVLGIDLSLPSLGRAARAASALALPNLNFAQADILEMGGWKVRYDLIEACGVLHYLDDPLRGLRILRGLLEPDGLLRLALFSREGRRPVLAARAIAAEGGFTAAPDSLRALRQRLLALPQDAPARGVVALADFHSTSACRHLLFPAREHAFDLASIAELVAAADMDLLGIEASAAQRGAFRAHFAPHVSLRDLDAWEELEQAMPDIFDGMIHVWARLGG
ncbi:methyltransferase [Coralloluteibacterium thermophilus]|uniref:Methyltransferase n=1 Tax=Coralloluteibacterium thermophilum TaxID=2707049 RepID=A0ABV9NRF9_9GAMM